MRLPDLAAPLARAFLPDDAAWTRHANPLSVWSRAATLPVLALAIWSRAWIGPWAWALVALLALWLQLNPTLFPPVRPNRGWSWRAVMGERLWTRRRAAPIPARHARRGVLLSALQVPPLILLAYGLAEFRLAAALLGGLGVYAAKFAFLEAMARLHDEVTPAPEAPI